MIKRLLIFSMAVFYMMISFSSGKTIYIDNKTNEYLMVGEVEIDDPACLETETICSAVQLPYFLNLNNPSLTTDINLSDLTEYKKISSFQYFEYLFDLGYSFRIGAQRPYITVLLNQNYFTVPYYKDDFSIAPLKVNVFAESNDSHDPNVALSFYSPDFQVYGFISSYTRYTDCREDDSAIQSLTAIFNFRGESYKGCITLIREDNS